jgi:hypothetical protein
MATPKTTTSADPLYEPQARQDLLGAGLQKRNWHLGGRLRVIRTDQTAPFPTGKSIGFDAILDGNFGLRLKRIC